MASLPDAPTSLLTCHQYNRQLKPSRKSRAFMFPSEIFLSPCCFLSALKFLPFALEMCTLPHRLCHPWKMFHLPSPIFQSACQSGHLPRLLTSVRHPIWFPFSPTRHKDHNASLSKYTPVSVPAFSLFRIKHNNHELKKKNSKVIL